MKILLLPSIGQIEQAETFSPIKMRTLPTHTHTHNTLEDLMHGKLFTNTALWFIAAVLSSSYVVEVSGALPKPLALLRHDNIVVKLAVSNSLLRFSGTFSGQNISLCD